MYKNYIFDLYGTLINLYTNEEKEEFWKKLSLFFSYNGAYYSANELKETYIEFVNKKIEKAREKTDYPDTKIIKVMKKLYKEKKVSPNKKLLFETMKIFRILSTESIEIYEGVIEVLEELKKVGKKLFILSNGQAEFSISELKYLGIYKYFDGIYFSADYNTCKPDEIFFDKLLKKENLNITECVMIGNDSTTDIDGANKIGIDSVYIHTNHSPKVNQEEIGATYFILDGNFRKLLELKKE